ncbi:MAG: VWA domain-containing protein [Acidobacteria bacterium]|nr:VWA domain-containing protein [Acidobacteriota bacterium]
MPSFAAPVTRLLSSLLVCLCLAAPPSHAQDAKIAPAQTPAAESDDVVRISSELWQTDVMVFDKGGKFVDGLKPEQFELRVDGKPQSVSFFERIKAGTVDEDAQLAAARGGLTRSPREKTGGAVVPLDRGRIIFFFVDDLHLSADGGIRMRKLLHRFVDEELRQNDVAAITSASGQIGFLQQLTDNKAVLRTAITRIGSRSSSVFDGERPPMSEVQAIAIERNDYQVRDVFVDALLRDSLGLKRQVAENMVEARARSIGAASSSVSANTLRSLEYMMRGASPLPGRKILFFISEGFPLDYSGNIKDFLRRVTDAAARSGVVIYSLDAQGLTSGMPDATGDRAFDPMGRLTSTDAQEISARQEPLHILAVETGGRALVNTNAIGDAVNKGLQESSVYYLLAWRPENAEGRGGGGGAKFHRIEVSLKDRPDLNVVVRRGFYDAPPPSNGERASAKKEKDKVEANAPTQSVPDRELAKAIRTLYPRSALPTSLALGYVKTQNGGTELTASLELTREAYGLLADGTKESARVDTALVVFDDRGSYVTSLKQQLTIPQALLTQAGPQHVMYTHTVSVKPGLYQVRVATRHQQSGRTGSAMQWIEVPELKQGQLSMSSIFLGERLRKNLASAVREETLESVELSVDRRFPRTSWVRFMAFIYNAAANANAAPDVALQIQIFRDDQPVLTAPLKKVSTEGIPDHTRIPYAAEVALDTFPAGRYILQLTAIDRSAKTSASQRVNFTIE